MNTSFSFVSCNQISPHKIWDGKRRLSFQAVSRARAQQPSTGHSGCEKEQEMPVYGL